MLFMWMNDLIMGPFLQFIHQCILLTVSLLAAYPPSACSVGLVLCWHESSAFVRSQNSELHFFLKYPLRPFSSSFCLRMFSGVLCQHTSLHYIRLHWLSGSLCIQSEHSFLWFQQCHMTLDSSGHYLHSHKRCQGKTEMSFLGSHSSAKDGLNREQHCLHYTTVKHCMLQHRDVCLRMCVAVNEEAWLLWTLCKMFMYEMLMHLRASRSILLSQTCCSDLLRLIIWTLFYMRLHVVWILHRQTSVWDTISVSSPCSPWDYWHLV